MNIPIENVVMLIGASQGALIGLIIVQKHGALYANRFLALMMFAISAVLVHMVLEDLGLYGSVRLLFPVLLALALTVTPLHFLYAKFLMDRMLRFGLRDALHFIPFAFFLAMGLALLGDAPRTGNFFTEHRPVQDYPLFLLLFNWAVILQGAAYVIVILRRIGLYERKIKNVYSSIENRRLRWLRNITMLAAAAWCSFIIEHIFFSFHVNLSNFMISSVLIAVYLFTLGYLGMLKSEVLEQSSPDTEDAEPAAADATKYEKSGLTPEAAALLKEKILFVMEHEKPYRQSDLTLPQLAGRIGASPHNCSEVINTRLGRTFYDLINEYRVRDVQSSLADPAKRHLKILALAFEAGFNSKASFNTIFKQLAGTTPSEFRKEAAAASERTASADAPLR